MRFKYVDIHTHPFKIYFPEPDKEVMEAWESGVNLQLFTATSREEFQEVRELSERFDFVKGVYGIHPISATGREDGEFLAGNIPKNAVAIGEIGLDLYRDTNPPKEVQIASFISQLAVAKRLRLPVVIHCREAFKELWEIVSKDEYSELKFIFHTFAEDWERAKIVLERPNFWLSFSGTVTFKNAQSTQEVAKNTPIERILTETDTPYLTPHPFRGKKNSSRNVVYVYNEIARLKGIPVEELIAAVAASVRVIFNF